jgi:hypothetical protein
MQLGIQEGPRLEFYTSSRCPIDGTGASLVYRKYIDLCDVNMRWPGSRPNNLLRDILRDHYEEINGYQARG